MNTQRAPDRSSRPRRALRALGVSILALAATQATAQAPAGGRILRGAAAIARTAAQTTITQTSQRAVIRWSGFDVGRTHSVVFDQPGRTSATLNRVISMNGSLIEGAIRAPGTVIIQNTAGVIFTGDAKVNVGGLVATSQWVDDEPFQDTGHLGMGGAQDRDAPVVNRGEITVRDAGLAALVGARVENSGVIVANRGTVALTSGRRTTIDLGGDGAFRIVVHGNAASGSSISNSGTIDVGEGRVVITAGDAARALDEAINTTGVIRATSGAGAGGQVQLLGQGSGKVRIAGAIDASGGTRGGEISASGATLTVARGADLAAQGAIDGGTVRLGGDAGGAGPLRRADHLIVERDTSIAANGAAGRGGRVIAWSAGDAVVDGALSATGAVAGGLVETSAIAALGIGEYASATLGRGGEWRINAGDVALRTGGLARDGLGALVSPPGAALSIVDRRPVIDTLNGGGDVAIDTRPPGAFAPGDITVGDDFAWSGGGDLRLLAARDIGIDAAVQTAGAGDFFAAADRDLANTGAVRSDASGNLALAAGRDLRIGNNLRAGGAGAVSLTARSGDITAADRAGADIAVSTSSGALRMEAEQGSILLRRSGAASDTLRVYSDHGDADLVAGARILARGGAGAGAWVRIGDAASGGELRLTAADIAIEGGTGGNSFAEVTAGAGGAIILSARDAIEARNNAASGSQGRIAALNGAALELQAPRQLWNGVVRSGSGASDGGPVLISGAIAAGVAPVLSLAPGADFTFAPTAPDGSPSSYASDLGLDVRTTGGGAVSLDAPVRAARIALISQERVGLGARARLRGEGPGAAVVVAAGRHFANAAGGGALETTDPAARWLLYVDTFAGLTGTIPTPGGFDLYSRSFRSAPPAVLAGFAGDRVVYGETPVLTVTAGSGARVYGGALADLGYTLAGLRPGDGAATALVGRPSVSSPGNRAAAAAGDYAATARATASAQGYRLAYVDGALRVDRAALIVAANDATRSFGTANPKFGARYAGFVLGQDASDLVGALTVATAATTSSPVGTYGLVPGGLTSGNYAIAYVEGLLTVTPAPRPSEQIPDINALTRPFARGAPPNTPGDASFRTTAAEAPPAIGNPFGLTYSLGEIVQLAPEGAAGAEGFTPASGGAAGAEGFAPASGGEAGATGGASGGASGGACGGAVNQGAGAVCARATFAESYWSTVAQSVR